MITELYTEEHHLFRESFNTFLRQEALPYYEQWEKDGQIDRSLWTKAAELGVLGVDIAEEYACEVSVPGNDLLGDQSNCQEWLTTGIELVCSLHIRIFLI